MLTSLNNDYLANLFKFSKDDLLFNREGKITEDQKIKLKAHYNPLQSIKFIIQGILSIFICTALTSIVLQLNTITSIILLLMVGALVSVIISSEVVIPRYSNLKKLSGQLKGIHQRDDKLSFEVNGEWFETSYTHTDFSLYEIRAYEEAYVTVYYYEQGIINSPHTTKHFLSMELANE